MTLKEEAEYRARLELEVGELLVKLSNVGRTAQHELSRLSSMKDFPDSALLYFKLQDAVFVLTNCGEKEWKEWRQ